MTTMMSPCAVKKFHLCRLAFLVSAFLICAPELWAQPLIGGNLTPNSLVSVDRDTAATVQLVGMVDLPQGLAYDPQTDALYGISANTDSVYLIDRNTGNTSTIVNLPYDNANGLAFDTTRGLIFGADNITNALFTVDPTNSAFSQVGVIAGAAGVEGLAFDPATETLFGLSDVQNELVVIDRDTAIATTILSGMPSRNWRGLTYDPTQGVLYASVAVSGSLYRIDDPTGTPSLVEIGTISPAGAVQGLAFIIPEPTTLTLSGGVILGLLTYATRRVPRRAFSTGI